MDNNEKVFTLKQDYIGIRFNAKMLPVECQSGTIETCSQIEQEAKSRMSEIMRSLSKHCDRFSNLPKVTNRQPKTPRIDLNLGSAFMPR